MYNYCDISSSASDVSALLVFTALHLQKNRTCRYCSKLLRLCRYEHHKRQYSQSIGQSFLIHTDALASCWAATASTTALAQIYYWCATACICLHNMLGSTQLLQRVTSSMQWRTCVHVVVDDLPLVPCMYSWSILFYTKVSSPPFSAARVHVDYVLNSVTSSTCNIDRHLISTVLNKHHTLPHNVLVSYSLKGSEGQFSVYTLPG